LREKSEVRFVNAGALLKKQYFFKRNALSTESVLTAPNDVLSLVLVTTNDGIVKQI